MLLTHGKQRLSQLLATKTDLFYCSIIAFSSKNQLRTCVGAGKIQKIFQGKIKNQYEPLWSFELVFQVPQQKGND